MSRLPDDLRANLPDDLAEAQLAGIDIADVDENVRLWGHQEPGSQRSLLFEQPPVHTKRVCIRHK